MTQRDQLAAYTRQALLHSYLTERRRLHWTHEVCYAEPPDRSSAEYRIDDRVALAAAMSRLGPRQRAVVVLRFWEDLSVQQTAAALDCSVGTITSQTHHALKTLRIVFTPSTPAP